MQLRCVPAASVNFATLLMLSWAPHSTFSQTPQNDITQPSSNRVRIATQLDETQLTKLRGNTSPLTIAASDRGAVSPDQPMSRMLMLLRRSPEQEGELDKLLAAQQGPGSPSFHKWLTPEEFGAKFGPAAQDIQIVTNWLLSHGFTGVSVSKGGTVIEFSGSAGQVESAFHTAIHRYEVGGTMHIANQSDPSIPASLTPVVAGIVSLNDFGRRSMAIRGPTLRSTKGQAHPTIVPGIGPDLTVPGPALISTFFGVAPYDFATIYDLLPLWNAGLDGTGQTIAIVGETDINLNDPEYFRAFLGLPVNNPSVIIAGADPGVQSDELESDLDVEWSGAIAKGAQIELVSSASTETTNGVDLSALYIVDNNLAPVMSESYGECELFLGSTANAFYSALWQQAAAEGITVLIASGDAGSAACDPTTPDANLAVHLMAVSGLASTPYNVAVGGTDFNQYNLWAQYWSETSNPTTKQSVLGYIPEIPWNDSCGSSTLDGTTGDDPTTACNSGTAGSLYLNTIASSGGPSSCVTSNGADASTCTAGWPKPIWQTGSGVPSDNVRDVPDVSLFASNGVYNSAYVVCSIDQSGGSGCDPSAATQTFIAVGGTSVSAPAMAGVMAIINQKYGRQGNANFTLYKLASSTQGPSIFHDITADGNRVACTSESADCQVPPGASEPIGRMSGDDSTVGYDMVTGLGSIDIANLVNNWSEVSYAPTKTTLALDSGTATVTAVHGSAINAAVSVSASSGSPSGDVSLIGATTNGSSFLGALQSGSVTGTVNSLPGGSYAVIAHYAGDTQFAPSNSSPVSVSISPEPSATTLTVLNYNTTTGLYAPAASPVPYGSLLLFRADVKGQSGYGKATGTAIFTDGGNSLGQFALNSQGNTEYAPSNLLFVGMHSLKASYSGDASFNASSGTNAITLTSAPMTCDLGTNTTYLRPGWVLVANASSVLYQAQLAPPLGTMVAPTGTISILSGSNLVAGPTVVTGSGSGSLTGGAFTLPNATIPTVTLQLASPTAPLTVVYSGDSNYGSCTSTPLLLPYETGGVISQVGFTLSAYQGIVAGTPVTMTANILASFPPPPYEPAYPVPTGTVQLAIDGANVGTPVQLAAGSTSGLTPNGTATVAVSTANLTAGSHMMTLNYSGDFNYLAGVSGSVNFGVVVPDFSITPNTSNLTLTSGQTSSPVTIQVAYLNGFTGTVTFSCSGLPSEAACNFSSSTVTNSGSTSLTIGTTQAESVGAGPVVLNHSDHFGWLAGAGGLSVACVIVMAVPVRKRKILLLCIGATCALFLGVTSCGGGSGGSSSTQPTQYFTVTSLTATTTTPAKGTNDTFTATVTPSGSNSTPTGTVQFSVDGTASGSALTLTNGTAQFQTSFSVAGPHKVSAAYSGDANDLSSTSNPLSLTVPYTSGSLPGSYVVTITATGNSLTHTTPLNLLVQ